MGAAPLEPRTDTGVRPDDSFGGRVPAPPLHARVLSVATALLVVVVGAAATVTITAPSGTTLGYTAGVVTAVAILAGGGVLAQAAIVRRRYVEALLRWAATDPPRPLLDSIVLALTATGAHREARTVLAVCAARSGGTVPDRKARS